MMGDLSLKTLILKTQLTSEKLLKKFNKKNSTKKIQQKFKIFIYYHDRGSEDRLCTIDNGCFEIVEWCRYVTGGMEFALTPLPSTTEVHCSSIILPPNPKMVYLVCVMLENV